MSTASRLVIVGVLVLAVGVTVALRRDNAPSSTAASASAVVALPRLVDVGADKYIPCKAMVPVLDELRREYADRLRVDFIDAWKYPDQAEPFNVYGIPMQIAGTQPIVAMLLMLAYAGGHCGVLALAGASGPWLAGYAAWSERGVSVLRRACGVLVLAGGLYLVYAAP